jgi:hypothetical protein
MSSGTSCAIWQMASGACESSGAGEAGLVATMQVHLAAAFLAEGGTSEQMIC